MKYFAVVAWVGYIWAFSISGWANRISILASLLNFFLFFGQDLVGRFRINQYSIESHVRNARERATPFHLCAICGLTEKKDPQADFRVCNKCTGGLEHCVTHLPGHEHRT